LYEVVEQQSILFFLCVGYTDVVVVEDAAELARDVGLNILRLKT
jgi:hypothetical protein